LRHLRDFPSQFSARKSKLLARDNKTWMRIFPQRLPRAADRTARRNQHHLQNRPLRRKDTGAHSMHPANLLLASLSASDVSRIRPHLRSVEPGQRILFEADDPINAVYFPTSAVISLVVGLSTGEMIEAAMVGKDGMVGAACALGGKISLSRAIVHISGNSLVCDVDALKGAALQSQSFLSKLVRHEQTIYTLRHSNPRPAWRPMTWRPGFAVGCFARGICPTVTRCH
jgi:hypothetical protein